MIIKDNLANKGLRDRAADTKLDSGQLERQTKGLLSIISNQIYSFREEDILPVTVQHFMSLRDNGGIN